jgi:hypothetical protein
MFRAGLVAYARRMTKIIRLTLRASRLHAGA